MSDARRAVALLALSSLVACAEARRDAGAAAETAHDAVSPIAGSWSVDGNAPAPKSDAPSFTHLDFASGGTLDADYAAGGGLADLAAPPKVKSEHDHYSLRSGGRLTILEGSRSLEYAYAVRDGELVLTPSGASTGTVFRKDGEGTSGAARSSSLP